MRTSDRLSNKVIPKSRLRADAKGSGKPQPIRRVDRTYCNECNHRKRGNTWDKDYCRKCKKLCKDARMGGQMARICCKGFEVLVPVVRENLK
jgi:hypothetical protein